MFNNKPFGSISFPNFQQNKMGTLLKTVVTPNITPRTYTEIIIPKEHETCFKNSTYTVSGCCCINSYPGLYTNTNVFMGILLQLVVPAVNLLTILYQFCCFFPPSQLSAFNFFFSEAGGLLWGHKFGPSANGPD